ncbi:glutamine--tRNA ligase/YqeY domain fusion protein [Thioalkalivibrio sp. HK1]|uniref:glutamine--tRNA ligase/YqeY domain fusion protein n=1 Tax=Thioalkalivibrio sp. HK1 TaxID=1469245 RepID=UPI000470306C|nr:glutamine--tRNA ligase/YqeY domain fusion protein [Thioalkalivibrio sp. HK1]
MSAVDFTSSKAPDSAPSNFIRQEIDADIAAGKLPQGAVITRFPPEPNGYLHIGHAKSICLNFGIARDYPNARCHLRFDDTNPSRERAHFMERIKEDVRWLGFDWGDRLRHASDYFDDLYGYAKRLIESGHAYVCSLSQEEIRSSRGTLTEAGRDSPWRDRPPEQSLDLFRRMCAGEFEEGAHVLRAKIDMASPNINLRDPVIYRIMHAPHPLTGRKWSVYPMYDFAQALSDAIERVTHSLCTLEFEDHRPLYDWFLRTLEIPSPPRQIEFSRLNLTHSVMSKRLLTHLVEQGHVSGWTDPRMPTIAGMRRRGFPPEALRDFCARIGMTKKDNIVELELLENCVREACEPIAPRAMAVLRPLRLVIENFPPDRREDLVAPNHPNDPSLGTRELPFTREVFIERDDFMEDPPAKFHRFAPGKEVRLRYAWLVTCTDVVRDPKTGEVVEIRGIHDPDSRGGNSPDGRKVRGTVHWVSARFGVPARVRLYDRLFHEAAPSPDPQALGGQINPASLEEIDDCILEPSLARVPPGALFQFERSGYFVADSEDHAPDSPVFNRTVSLRDTWGRKRGR